MRIVGVDPGGATTGVVLREGREARRAILVSPDKGAAFERYLRDVIEAVEDCMDDAFVGFEAELLPLLAVEDVVHPNPHLGIANLDGLLATAQVLGAIRWAAAGWERERRISRLVVVPPGRHGSAPLSAYPGALVGPRETKGSGTRRHVRSAWDIAGAGAQIDSTPAMWAMA